MSVNVMWEFRRDLSALASQFTLTLGLQDNSVVEQRQQNNHCSSHVKHQELKTQVNPVLVWTEGTIPLSWNVRSHSRCFYSEKSKIPQGMCANQANTTGQMQGKQVLTVWTCVKRFSLEGSAGWRDTKTGVSRVLWIKAVNKAEVWKQQQTEDWRKLLTSTVICL